MEHRAELGWVYLGEVIVALLLAVALVRLVGAETILKWLMAESGALATLLTIGTAATAITFGAFVALLTTDFGRKLRLKGEATVYVSALAVPLLLFIITLSLASLGKSTWGEAYEYTLLFLLIYSALNFVTMLKNVIDLVGLWQAVDQAAHRHREGIKRGCR